MPKPITKPKIFKRTSERIGIPTAHKHKIKIDIKDLSDFKKLEHKFKDKNSCLTSEENIHYIELKKKIWKVHNKNISIRSTKFMKLFGVDTIHLLSEAISSRYPNTIAIGLHPNSKYNKMSNAHAINFKWRLDKEENAVHMFEWNNLYGLDSRNPLYQEFKKLTIQRLRESYEDKLNKDTKFIVDSEVIDK